MGVRNCFDHAIKFFISTALKLLAWGLCNQQNPWFQLNNKRKIYTNYFDINFSTSRRFIVSEVSIY